MSDPKSKALKKIAKCLELSNSANVNEAAQAIKMAERLMRKHGLDQDDIDFISMGKTRSEKLLPASISQSILKIIRGINSRFGVECVLVNHKGLKQAEFIGDADRAIFAAFAFDVVYRDMNEHIGQFRNSFAGSGTSTQQVTRRFSLSQPAGLKGRSTNCRSLMHETATTRSKAILIKNSPTLIVKPSSNSSKMPWRR